jgi:hypothetical protein
MPEKRVTVTVTPEGISVDPPSVQVQKGHHFVKWVCETSPFTIDLPGYQVTYQQEGRKYVGQTGVFPALGKIKYDVSAPGAPTLDPEVDVIPFSAP